MKSIRPRRYRLCTTGIQLSMWQMNGFLMKKNSESLNESNANESDALSAVEHTSQLNSVSRAYSHRRLPRQQLSGSFVA